MHGLLVLLLWLWLGSVWGVTNGGGGGGSFSQSFERCLLGKGAVEFIFVQLVLWADHNCIATCQISVKTQTEGKDH